MVKTGGLLAAGLFYAFLCFLKGSPLIPCLFHQLTGLYCPGCGVSRMCMALLCLDFKTAFKANAAVFLLLPAGLIIALQMGVRYIKKGRIQPTRTQTILFFLMTALLLVFSILRNLPAFIWMAPPSY